mgnify:CR=1 FL=1
MIMNDRVENWKKNSKPEAGEKTLFGEDAIFRRGLYEIGPGIHAWMQPNGSTSESNCGVITSNGETLIFDTAFDLRLTRHIIKAIEPITSKAPVTQVINSHANGDHTYGNQLFPGAEIIATHACKEEFKHEDPRLPRAVPIISKTISCCGLGGLPLWPYRKLDKMGKYLGNLMKPFDLTGVVLTPPTKTFTGEYKGYIGNIEYRIIEVGPAHTCGDAMLYFPESKVLFAGDVLFIEGTPAAWANIDGWISAIEVIESMDVEVIVPGHGPIIDKSGLDDLKSYFKLIQNKVPEMHLNGMDPVAISRHLLLKDPDFKAFQLWDSPERIVLNVSTVCKTVNNKSPDFNTFQKLNVIYHMADLAYDLPDAAPSIMRS